MSKTKHEALRIIHNCAVVYQSNLLNKNVLFIVLNEGKPEFFETAFLQRNFLHLTGIRTMLNSTTFFVLAVKDRLRESDITFADDGTTDKKLDVLMSLMNIYKTAKMVGNYDNSQRLLVTDKLAGTVTSAIGFRKDGDYYMPNTSLKADMRTISIKPIKRVAMILIKDIKDVKYMKLTYSAKGITISDAIFATIINEKVEIK